MCWDLGWGIECWQVVMVVVQGSSSFHPRPEPKNLSHQLSGNFKIGNSTKYVLFASTWHIDIQPLSVQHKSLFNVLEWCQIFWIINVPINLSFTEKSGAYTHFWIVQVSTSCLDWSIFCFWYFAIKENITLGETWFEFSCSATSLGKILIWE